jgi:hypothetical protein
MELPTRLTIARFRDKFEADCTVHKEISGKTFTATTLSSSAVVLEDYTRSPTQSAK